ncbi:Uncharacterized protein TPAR_05444 [Tolypocladium paradoxum]|uniref:SnoaL-like domain-containing protein n=1 Tax=Tolypocladium paradoxum TaxID=94208 RepID=A0A2S4KW39_9HYPO|nr:Uncharacterized protein TPAR_05444 [Tolypocladium paradoxum]
MPHSYRSEVPCDPTVDAGILDFFETFYRISDTPGHHDAYVANFTDDATFILASKMGPFPEILATRQAMWAQVASRKHAPTKIFPFGGDSREFMLYGTVEFVFKDGRHGELPWAARAVMDNSTGKWLMSFYQVYLDTGGGVYDKR